MTSLIQSPLLFIRFRENRIAGRNPLSQVHTGSCLTIQGEPNRRAFLIIFLVFAGAFVFVCLIFSAPALLHSGCRRAALYNYLLFAPVCHQLPGRSFSVFGAPCAVCARCAGIYLGFLAGTGLLLFFGKESLRKCPDPKLFYIVCVPMAVDASLGMIGFYSSQAFLRAMTGFLAGVVLPFYVVPGIFEIISRQTIREIARI